MVCLGNTIYIVFVLLDISYYIFSFTSFNQNNHPFRCFHPLANHLDSRNEYTWLFRYHSSVFYSCSGRRQYVNTFTKLYYHMESIKEEERNEDNEDNNNNNNIPTSSLLDSSSVTTKTAFHPKLNTKIPSFVSRKKNIDTSSNASRRVINTSMSKNRNSTARSRSSSGSSLDFKTVSMQPNPPFRTLLYDHLALSSLDAIKVTPHHLAPKRYYYLKKWWVAAKKWNLLSGELKQLDEYMQLQHSFNMSIKSQQSDEYFIDDNDSNDNEEDDGGIDNNETGEEISTESEFSRFSIGQEDSMIMMESSVEILQQKNSMDPNLSSNNVEDIEFSGAYDDEDDEDDSLDTLDRLVSNSSFDTFDTVGFIDSSVMIPKLLKENSIHKTILPLTSSNNNDRDGNDDGNSDSNSNNHNENDNKDDDDDSKNNNKKVIKLNLMNSNQSQSDRPYCLDRNYTIPNHLIPFEELVNICNRNHARVIVIGDVHGCIEELIELLQKVEYRPGDLVVFLGDLVAKGPSSHEVIRLAIDINAISIRGNHEQEVISQGLSYYRTGKTTNKEHFRLALQLNIWEFKWLCKLPYYMKSGDLGSVFVHAGFQAGIPIHQQDPFCMMMIRSTLGQNKPSTRSYIDKPWANKWTGPLTAYFGHDAVRGLQVYQHAIGLDTGCVYGGNLSAMILPDKEFVSVKARRVYKVSLRCLQMFNSTKDKEVELSHSGVKVKNVKLAN